MNLWNIYTLLFYGVLPVPVFRVKAVSLSITCGCMVVALGRATLDLRLFQATFVACVRTRRPQLWPSWFARRGARLKKFK